MPKTLAYMICFRGGPHDGLRRARPGRAPKFLFCERRALDDYDSHLWADSTVPVYGTAKYELLKIAETKHTNDFAGWATYRYLGIHE